jgi:rubredoxin
MTENYAYVETSVLCPVCGHEFENTEGHIRVQIGKLERWYKIGEHIEWNDDLEREQVAGLSPVYVFDSDDDYSLWHCQACRTLFDSPAAIVESGRITRVCLMTEAQARALFGLDRGFADIVGYDSSTGKWVLIGDMVPRA